MHKRPWPLVILAIFQLLTPVGSLLFSSIANQMDVFSFTQDLWQNGNWVTKFSVFGLPPILAGLIYFTRRMGLFLLTAAVLAQTGMNIVTWGRATNSMSLSMLVLVSVINLALIAYLLLPSVREIFFNPDIRWWERQPRYILNAPAEIIFEGGVRSCFIHDLSRGGASLECNPGQITPGDQVVLKFKTQGRELAISTRVVYERVINAKFSRYGVRRVAGELTGETIMVDSLIAALVAAKVQTHVSEAPGMGSLWAWLRLALRSPKAWIPESAPNRKSK